MLGVGEFLESGITQMFTNICNGEEDTSDTFLFQSHTPLSECGAADSYSDSEDEATSPLEESEEKYISEWQSSQQQRRTLTQYGFQYLYKIQNTLQGKLFKAKTKPSTGNSPDVVIIKKTNKILYDENVGIEEGTIFYVYEDILMEATLLKDLTVDNKYGQQRILNYVGFFETEADYYLVMEHIDGSMNLKEFVEKSHEYINDKKMKKKHYTKIIKYLFWQIFEVMHWLHSDMNC